MIKNFVYGALLSAAFIGCSSNQKPVQQTRDVIPIANVQPANLESIIAAPAPSKCPPQDYDINRSIIEISSSYEQSEAVELTPKTKEFQNPIFLDFKLEFKKSYLSNVPNFTGFNLDSVSFNYEPVRDYPLNSLNFYKSNNIYNPFSSRQQRRNSSEFGVQELQATLYAAREIVRELAKDGYAPFISLNRLVLYTKRIGDRLRAIQRGIQGIWSLDLGDLENDLSNPFAQLRSAVNGDGEYDARRVSRRKKSGPIIDGAIEPTLQGRPIGSRSGQGLLSIFSGKSDADLGLQLRVKIDF